MTEELHIVARDIRAGDVFTLHSHERTAIQDAWSSGHTRHVHIPFVGGGDAVIPADRPLTVRRTVGAPCATA